MKLFVSILVMLLILPMFGIISTATEPEDDKPTTTTNVTVVVSADPSDGVMPDFLIVDHPTLQQAIDNPDLTVLPVRNDITLLQELGALTIPANRRPFTITSATGQTLTITQPNKEHRHFNINKNASIIFSKIELAGGNDCGGVSITDGAIATISGLQIKNCEAETGGAIFIENASLSLAYSLIRSSYAGNGGGIFVGNGAGVVLDGVNISACSAGYSGGGIGLAQTYGSLTFTGSGVSFAGNFATNAYWIEKDSVHTFFDKTAVNWKLLYVTSYKAFVNSLTQLKDGVYPFGYMFNNYDVSYIGSEHAKIPPIADRVVFSPLTYMPAKLYEGEASSELQLLNLVGSKPTIEIYNTTNDIWSLSVSYTPFLVSRSFDHHLKFALRDENGEVFAEQTSKYRIFNPESTQLAYQAHDETLILYIVPWGDDEDDMLKVLLPEYRHDLNEKKITSTLLWSLGVMP
ncbi:MAG: hypothetical protein FWD44_02670 [Oscillospiraceae bacterium]|nr:hypothetical protein [Oscillospiraceae bacterium]